MLGRLLGSLATGGIIAALTWLILGSFAFALALGALGFVIGFHRRSVCGDGASHRVVARRLVVERLFGGGWSSGSSSSDSGGFSGGGGSFGGGGASGSW